MVAAVVALVAGSWARSRARQQASPAPPTDRYLSGNRGASDLWKCSFRPVADCSLHLKCRASDASAPVAGSRFGASSRSPDLPRAVCPSRAVSVAGGSARGHKQN